MANDLSVIGIVIYLPQDQPNVTPESHNMGATAFAYIFLRPDTFRLNSTGGGVLSTSQTQQLQVWGWIENSTSCKSNAFSHPWIDANERKWLQLHHFWNRLILHFIFGLLFAPFPSIIPQLGSGAITDSRGKTRIPPYQIRQFLSFFQGLYQILWRHPGRALWI